MLETGFKYVNIQMELQPSNHSSSWSLCPESLEISRPLVYVRVQLAIHCNHGMICLGELSNNWISVPNNATNYDSTNDLIYDIFVFHFNFPIERIATLISS